MDEDHLKTRVAGGPDVGLHLLFWCPGCGDAHEIRVVGKGAWSWDGDRDRPTVEPSIRVRGTRPITNDEYRRLRAGEPVTPEPRLCHSFLRKGQLEFLADCTHALAGRTIALPDWPY